jgi:hypothetical protein
MPVKNQGTFKIAVSTLESRVVPAKVEKTGMQGTNGGGFENRVTQEGGQH